MAKIWERAYGPNRFNRKIILLSAVGIAVAVGHKGLSLDSSDRGIPDSTTSEPKSLRSQIEKTDGLPLINNDDEATADGEHATDGEPIEKSGEEREPNDSPAALERPSAPDYESLNVDTNVPSESGPDVSPPYVDVLNPTAPFLSLSRDRYVTISVQVHDSGKIREVTIDGEIVEENSSGLYSTHVKLTDDGENFVEIVATDEAANVNRNTVGFWLDTQPPEVTVKTPLDGATIEAGKITVRGTIRDAKPRLGRGTLTVLVNGVPAVVRGESWKAPLDVVASTDSIRIEATDHAGNRMPPRSLSLRVEAPPATLDGFTFLWRNPHGLDEYRHNATGIVMVSLPGGRFSMGSRSEYSTSKNERPRREVEVDPFLMAKYEVSQEEWLKVMGRNPSKFRDNPNLPVEEVSWFDCQKFCVESQLALPTEAEWEYACRAGTNTPFAFGTIVDSHEMNYDGRHPFGKAKAGVYRERTVPVGQFRPNNFGLHNLHGNVLEWCADVYSENFYKHPHSRAKNPRCKNDPVLEGDTGRYVARGGSWSHDGLYCRSAARHGLTPSRRSPTIGVRPVYRLR